MMRAIDKYHCEKKLVAALPEFHLRLMRQIHMAELVYPQAWKYAVSRLGQRSWRCWISAQLFMSRAVRCDRHRATVRTPDRPSFRFCTPAVFNPAVSAQVLRWQGLTLTADLDVDVMLFM